MSCKNFFHSIELFVMLEHTPGMKPYMVVVKDDTGNVQAHMLTILRRRGALFPPYIFTQGRSYGEGEYAPVIYCVGDACISSSVISVIRCSDTNGSAKTNISLFPGNRFTTRITANRLRSALRNGLTIEWYMPTKWVLKRVRWKPDRK